MKQLFTWMLLSITVFPLYADQTSEEYRLLKSWGLEFNAKGYLKFRQESAESAEEMSWQPWQPEMGEYQKDLVITRSETAIDPLIISSKPQQANMQTKNP